MRRILILDTSILCCWLKVPGKDTAGPVEDLWDHDRIERLLAHEAELNSTFVLPLAALIETGNHISQAASRRFDCATLLVDCLRGAVDRQSPWAAFMDQSSLWSEHGLRRLIDEWPDLAAARMSIGDATIKDVADYYALAGWHVEILTGDAGLKAYQPSSPAPVPRRRR